MNPAPIRVDFTGVETREFEPLPRGRYLAAPTSAPVQEGAESGENYIAWEFTVQGGDFDGRKAWNNTSLQPQALWSTKRVLRALGVPEEELSGVIEDIEALLEDVMNRECIIVIGHRKFEGETRQDLRRVLPVEEGVAVDKDTPF